MINLLLLAITVYESSIVTIIQQLNLKTQLFFCHSPAITKHAFSTTTICNSKCKTFVLQSFVFNLTFRFFALLTKITKNHGHHHHHMR